MESRALSSFDSQYNSLRDTQKNSNLDYMNGLSAYQAKQPGCKKPIQDTKSYLNQLEHKYQKKYGHESDSEEYDNDKIEQSHVPSKFVKTVKPDQSIQREFHIPQNLSLSKGPSEQNFNYGALQDMQERYLSNNPSVLSVDQSQKRRFFEMAVNIKKSLPQNHPGQEILIAQLYNEVIRLGIKEAAWGQYISGKFGK